MRFRFFAPVLLVALLVGACDAVEPVEEPHLVVEGFLDAGKQLPDITLRRTLPLTSPYDVASSPVSDADVILTLDGVPITYLPRPDRPGVYAPSVDTIVAERIAFRLNARWNDEHAVASGIVPPPIRIDSVRLDIPETPVEAVLLDSLNLDSLDTGAIRGFIYPVEVTLWWAAEMETLRSDSLYWVRTQLKPYTRFSSTVIDFFLRPGQIIREFDLAPDAFNRRQWTGVYAVPVDTKDDPMPPHELQVALLRSGRDYALFASSRDDPKRREPVSNVSGGVGIVAGISIDSLRLHVEAASTITHARRSYGP